MDRVAMVRNAYRLWSESRGKSGDTWIALFADNVRLRSLAGGAQGMEFSHECHSRADVERYFAGIAADWQMVHYTPERWIAQGDDLAVLCTCSWKHRRTGKVMESLKSDFFRFSGDKVVEFIELYDTYGAIAATQGATVAESTVEKDAAPA
jgi:ketosteroid isomerase-like protein